MSRIGKKPIPIPDSVTVKLSGRTVEVEGAKGRLAWTYRPEISVQISEEDKIITVTRSRNDRLSRGLHGLTRSLLANMIEGCSKGYSKSLEVYGVGYGAQLQGDKLSINCGFSHPVVFDIAKGLTVEVITPQARGDNAPARFNISGADKQAVGELAASIRKSRPPEPYNGKGIRYAGEHVRRKAGKAFAGAGG